MRIDVFAIFPEPCLTRNDAAMNDPLLSSLSVALRDTSIGAAVVVVFTGSVYMLTKPGVH